MTKDFLMAITKYLWYRTDVLKEDNLRTLQQQVKQMKVHHKKHLEFYKKRMLENENMHQQTINDLKNKLMGLETKLKININRCNIINRYK